MGLRSTPDVYTRYGWIQGEAFYTGEAPTEGEISVDDIETTVPGLHASGSVFWANGTATPTDGVEGAEWVACDVDMIDENGDIVRKGTLAEIEAFLPDPNEEANEQWANS